MKIVPSIFIYSIFLLFTSVNIKGQDATSMLEKILPAVVTVAVYEQDSGNIKRLLGFNTRGVDGNAELAYQQMLDLNGSKGSGSGFIIEKNKVKYIITNAHVVETATDDGIFAFSIAQKKYKMKVIGGDSFFDLAVLGFVDPPGNEFEILQWEDSNTKIGQTVYALGNPLGEYPFTVTQGIISGKNRTRGSVTGKFGFLQSSATVIWGNSGGPLVNLNGNVVGINSQIGFAKNKEESIWQPQINFALESEIARKMVDEIIQYGYVKRAYLGVDIGQKYKITGGKPLLIDQRPILYNVFEGSPAAKILNDMIGKEIVEVNNNEVRNVEEVLGEFEKIKPGQKTRIGFKNGNTVLVKELDAIELRSENLVKPLILLIKQRNMDAQVLDDEMVFTVSERKAASGMSGNSVSRYPCISAGVYNAKIVENSFLWRVKSLAELGAVARITILYGYVDILLADNSKGDFFEQTLLVSKEKGTYNKTVWY